MKPSNLYTLLYSTCRIGVCTLVVCLSTACSDWFDTSPKTDLTAEKLFSTEAGFESALTGIYLSMVDGGAYGDNMSFGLLDQLAQQYDYIPDGANDRAAIYNYATATQTKTTYRYTDSKSPFRVFFCIA